MPRDPETSLALLTADVYELAGALRRHGDHLAGRVGQTQARWQLLSVISDGTWTVPQAASRLGVSRQAVQRVANDLEVEDLIRYAPNPRHRRSPVVEPTAAGRAALAAITAAASEWQAEMAKGLDGAAVDRARVVLRELLDRMEAGESPDDR